jgi:hypothetical protein
MPKRKRVTTEEFIRRARKVHGELYDYSRVVLLSTNLPVTIICREHGPFEQWAANHLRGTGCPACSRKRVARARTLPPSEIEARVRNLHPSYVLDRDSYQARENPSTWRCTRHDTVFCASPESLAHRKNAGCPSCIAEAGRAGRREARHDPNAEEHLAIVGARLDSRYAEAYTLYLDGATLREIGEAFSVTGERVGQWIARVRAVVDRFDRDGKRIVWRRWGKPPAPLKSLFYLDRN